MSDPSQSVQFPLSCYFESNVISLKDREALGSKWTMALQKKNTYGSLNILEALCCSQIFVSFFFLFFLFFLFYKSLFPSTFRILLLIPVWERNYWLCDIIKGWMPKLFVFTHTLWKGKQFNRLKGGPFFHFWAVHRDIFLLEKHQRGDCFFAQSGTFEVQRPPNKWGYWKNCLRGEKCHTTHISSPLCSLLLQLPKTVHEEHPK